MFQYGRSLSVMEDRELLSLNWRVADMFWGMNRVSTFWSFLRKICDPRVLFIKVWVSESDTSAVTGLEVLKA